MASFIDRLRNLGRGLLSRLSEGAARGLASFSERYERNASLVYQQRSHLPRGRVNELKRQHLTGERLMTAIQRGAGGIGWPSSWSQDRARQVQMFRRWVFVGCDRICSTVASLPPHLGYVRPRKRKKPRRDEDAGAGSAKVTKRKRNRRHGRRRRRQLKAYYEARYRKSMHAIGTHEEVEEVGDDHPCMRLLKKPNAWDHSPGQLWYELVLFLLLTGNAYLWVVPDRAFGKPLELWVIPSQWVWGPKLNAAGAREYEVMPYIGGAGTFTIPAEEIVHFHFKNPLNKVDGYAPIQAGAAWIDVSESIDDSRYWTFKQGTQASGALELGPKYDPDDVDIDAIGAKFLARYQGERNAGQPLILPPDVKMVPLTIAPSEMSFEGGFEQVRDSILALLAVPKGIAGITDPGSDRALWGERAVFMEQAIAPRLRYIAETFSATVCKRWDDELRMYWEDPTPPDPQQINSDLNVDYQHGLRTINEGRSLRGLEPLDDPWADEVMLQPNLLPLSVLRKQQEQQEQQAQQAQQQQQMQAQQAQQAPAGGMPGAGQEPLFDQPMSDQQAQQGQWAQQANQLADQIGAEDAAMGVNDQAWQDQEGAVKKAHEYNQKAAESGSRFRLELDATTQRWRARSLNGHAANGHLTNGHAATALLEKKKTSRHNGTVSVHKSAPDGRVTREDFGYAAPPKGKDVPNFAQCESCHKWTGQSCLEFAPSDRASADGACDFYAYGTPIGAAGIGRESSGTTPEAAGYVERQVRCENCARSNRTATRCEFYAEQNKKNPKRFALDTVVTPQSCCNAQAPKADKPGGMPEVRKAWESSKHPRGGNSKNPGQFSHGNGAATRPYPPSAPEAESPPLEATRLTRGEVRPTAAPQAVSHPLPSPSTERSPLRRTLEESPVSRKERLDGGANQSFVLTLEDGTKGLYKPSAGEQESVYSGVPFQMGYRREVAASRVADVLGLNDLVPATTFRGKEDDDIGSIQAFVGDTLPACSSAQPFDGPEDLARGAAFDYLLLNHDRHFGNWLLVLNKKLTLIDNGTSLPVKHDQSDIIYSQSYLLKEAVQKDMPLPDLSAWKHKWGAIEKELLDAGIEHEAIDLAYERFYELTRGGHKTFGDLPAFGVKDSLRNLVHDEDTKNSFWGR